MPPELGTSRSSAKLSGISSTIGRHISASAGVCFLLTAGGGGQACATAYSALNFWMAALCFPYFFYLPPLLFIPVPGGIQEHIAEERLIKEHDISLKDMDTSQGGRAFGVLRSLERREDLIRPMEPSSLLKPF
ncbi:hypothetical protein OE88DRAFT_387053 [Heliocybe sulcata]|uniref:Uncharacterized protein n=1 Tax=Heliocybe sulcata TaxID=5364 RepID=A0A5C3MWY0_9AGAM|nr:hypothetical protein OE88DRAFT_387053 [Heliocybe sulcata]